MSPTIIVLDTDTAVRNIFEHYGHALTLLKRTDGDLCSFDNIVDALIHEADYCLNIGILAQEVSDEVDVYNPYFINTDDLRHEITVLGKEIYRELKIHRLYSDGLLQCGFHGWKNGFLLVRYQPRKKTRSYVPIFI